MLPMNPPTLTEESEPQDPTQSQKPLRQEETGSEVKSPRLFIRDDNGWAWTIEDGHVVPVIDLIAGVKGTGFPCADWGDAVAILNRHEYITGITDSLEGDVADIEQPEF
jgi:hypothetical protein